LFIYRPSALASCHSYVICTTSCRAIANSAQLSMAFSFRNPLKNKTVLLQEHNAIIAATLTSSKTAPANSVGVLELSSGKTS
jgi:hypothetical protein